MKYKVFLSIIAICATIFLIGCKKSSNSTSNSTITPYFMKVTVNGANYSNDLVNFGGLDNQNGCNSKVYNIDYISQIYVSNFSLNVMIKHLQNNTDFNGSVHGTYLVKEMWNNSEETICNFELEIGYEDKTQSNQTVHLTGTNNIHNITSVKLKSQNSTSYTYDIEGNFSCSVKNSANAIINITGTYKSNIETLK